MTAVVSEIKRIKLKDGTTVEINQSSERFYEAVRTFHNLSSNDKITDDQLASFVLSTVKQAVDGYEEK